MMDNLGDIYYLVQLIVWQILIFLRVRSSLFTLNPFAIDNKMELDILNALINIYVDILHILFIISLNRQECRQVMLTFILCRIH